MTSGSQHDHSTCAHHVHNKPAVPSSHVDTPTGTIWTCPMHPQIRRNGPGQCPICGMALEPLEPALDQSPNPELIEMTRRFWVSASLSLPLLLLAMGMELFGWNMIPMRTALWVQ
ncbi:MAG: heavy metal-binding domain-containing protein, partial [Myxococcales bacterium]